MPLNELTEKKESLNRTLYERLRELNARIAVVGTKTSAAGVLEAIKHTEIPFLGVFEITEPGCPSEFHGFPVQPIEKLSKLTAADVVLIASSAQATELYDTFTQIQSLCPARVLNLRMLLDTFFLREELKPLLKFEYDDFLFLQNRFPEDGQLVNWYPLPPGVDFKDKTVLELGPFEGQVSAMIVNQAPKKVIALEARPVNFAKTSVIRSLYNWKNYELILGDMHLFPQLVEEELDIIFCSGVLYHSAKPWWLLKSCLDHCENIVLCTHVTSEHSPAPRAYREVALESGVYRFEVRREFGWDDGLSGVTSESLWFAEEDLIRFVNYHGFQYERYSMDVNTAGLLIRSVITRNIPQSP